MPGEIMTFRLLAGTHVDTDPTPHPDGRVVDRVYKKGEFVQTHKDLVKLFGEDKFERVFNVPAQLPAVAAQTAPATVPPPPPPPGFDLRATLNGMSEDELRKYAASEEIDLGKARGKAAVLDAILKATDA